MIGKNAKDSACSNTEQGAHDPSLLTFPTRFPIKVMGRNQAAFREAVEVIVAAGIAADDVLEIREKLSRNERFLAITITANFSEKAAIDKIYTALTRAPEVMMAL